QVPPVPSMRKKFDQFPFIFMNEIDTELHPTAQPGRSDWFAMGSGEFGKKCMDIGDPVCREAPDIRQPIAQRRDRAGDAGKLIDPGGGDQVCGRCDLETGAGSKPLIEHVNQARSAVAAKQRAALGVAVRQELIELRLLAELLRKIRGDRLSDSLKVKF